MVLSAKLLNYCCELTAQSVVPPSLPDYLAVRSENLNLLGIDRTFGEFRSSDPSLRKI